MADDDKIKYSDIIQPDDSIDKLIQQLERLTSTYESMLEGVRTGANKMSQSLKQASGATSEGRAAIEETAAATKRLKKAQEEVDSALGATSKAVTELRAKTAENNKVTAETRKMAKTLASSYANLNRSLGASVRQWNSLSKEEQNNEETGGKLLDNISRLKEQVLALTSSLKPLIESYSIQENAIEKLTAAAAKHASLQGEEGKALLGTIRETEYLTEAYRQQLNVETQLARAQARKEQLYTDEYEQLVSLRGELSHETKLRELDIQLAKAAPGSYNQLSLQYRRNKLELNAMGAEMRNTTEYGKNLEKETLELYKRMVALQEATGNHKLSVGNYTKAWDGLGFSISQVVRELPNAAVGINTLFLALSNNIPIVVDEIKKLKEANAAAAAAGKPTKSIIGSITSALFSWHTALIIGITLLTTHGDKIIEWIGDLFSGERATLSAAKAAKLLNKELKNQSDEYGKNIVAFKKLAKSWKELPVDERIEAVDAYAEALEDLGLKAKDLNSIEELFNSRTSDVQNAFKARAKAAAAMALAEKKYAEAFELEEKLRAGDTSFWEDIRIGTGDLPDLSYYFEGGWLWGRPKVTGESIKKLIEEENQAAIDRALAQGNQYFQISESYKQEEQERLGAFALEDPTKGGGRLDLSQRLANQRLKILEKYEKSATRLKESSVEERAGKEIDARRAENEQLKSLYAQNAQLLKANSKAEQGEFTLRGKKHKALTETQVADVQDSNAKILEIITNNNSAIAKEQHELELKLQNQSLTAQRKTVNLRLDTVKKGTEEELRLRLQALDLERKQTLANNALADPGARVAAADINKSFEAKRLLLLGEAKLEAFEQTQDLAAAEFNMVKRTSEEITAFEIQQEIDLWTMKISLAKQGMLKWGDVQIAEAEAFLKKLGIEQVDNAIETQQSVLEILQETIDLRLETVKKGSAEETNLLLQNLENERKQALLANKLLPESQRQSEDDINASFDTKSQRLLGDAWLERFEQNQASKKAEFDMVKHVSEDITAFELQQEKELWLYKIALAEAGLLDWSQAQIDAAKQAVDGINKELDEITGVEGVIGSIAERGIGGTLLAKMGFDNEGIEAFNDATNTIIGNLQSIMEAEVQLAEAAVAAAQERADSAKSALDAEIEARNNGYANNVASAKKEYELEKKRVADNQKLLQQAKRQQERLDTAMQTNSLITASANIWKAMSGVPFIGPALAIAAIASMWASFAAAKVKARQVAAAQQEYGEGGLEFLEGGSHASGHDISLGTKNSRGKNMRAEGGEALAIINRRNTKRYRKQLPGIIESLNKGTFEDKYLRAFDTGSQLSLRVEPNRVDLSKIEGYVEKISNQETTQRVALPDGTMLVVRKNVRRIIKSC